VKRSTKAVLWSTLFLGVTIYFAFSCRLEVSPKFGQPKTGPVIVGTRPDPKDASED
jgi:hypothetical protein